MVLFELIYENCKHKNLIHSWIYFLTKQSFTLILKYGFLLLRRIYSIYAGLSLKNIQLVGWFPFELGKLLCEMLF